MKKSMQTMIAGLYLLSVGSLTLAEAGDLSAQDPWVREAPPMAKVLAAFMLIENKGSINQQIKAASSPDFEHVEIHKTVVEDGVAKMQRQAAVEIPAGGSLSFAPGSYHFMLISPLKPVHADDQIEMLLSFANGEQLKVEAKVRKVMEEVDNMQGMQHQSGMSTN